MQFQWKYNVVGEIEFEVHNKKYYVVESVKMFCKDVDRHTHVGSCF